MEVRNHSVSRRRLMSGFAALAGAAALPLVTACSSQSASPSPQAQPSPKVVTTVVTKEVVVTATPAPAQKAPQASNGPVTVEIMYSSAADNTNPETKTLRSLFASYHKEHPNVTVKQTDMPWVGQRQALITRLVSGDAPDMAIIHANHAAEMGSGMRAIEPMENFTDFLTFAQTFIPSRLATTEFQGKHWGVPWQGLIFGIAYNKKIFKEVGVQVPKTWDELKQVAKAVTIPGKRYGIGWVMSQKLDTGYRTYPLVLKDGGRFMNDSLTKYIFDDEQHIEAVNLMMDIKKEGATVPGMASWTLDQEGQIVQGQSAVMTIGGPWIPGEMKQYAPDWDLMKVPMPSKPSGSHKPATLSDDIMLSIFHLGKEKEAAYDVMKFIRTPEADAELWLGPNAGGGLPVTKGALKDPRWQKYWAHSVFAEELNDAVPWPYSSNLSEAQTIYALEISRAFIGQASVKEALAAGVQKANAGLKKTQG